VEHGAILSDPAVHIIGDQIREKNIKECFDVNYDETHTDDTAPRGFELTYHEAYFNTEQFVERIKFKTFGQSYPYCFDKCLPYTKVPWFLDQTKAKEYFDLTHTNPDCSFDEHDHPLSAALRYYAQKKMEWKMNSKCYVDYYGSVRNGNNRKWSAMPLLTAKDTLKHYGKRCCAHEVCQCKQFEKGMIVDVLYYLKPSKIHELVMNVSKHELWSMHHTMSTSHGHSLCGEYRWHTRYRDGKTDFVVNIGPGQSNTYIHKDTEWTKQQKWAMPGGYLYYTVKGVVGPYEIGVFTFNHANLRVMSPIEPMWVEVKSQVYVPPAEGWLYWFDKLEQWIGTKPIYEEITVRVPIDLYYKLQIKAMFADDKKKMYETLKNVAVRWMVLNESEYRMSPEEFATMMPHAICAALVSGLPGEYGSLNKLWNDVNLSHDWKKKESRTKRLVISGLITTAVFVAGALTGSTAILATVTALAVALGLYKLYQAYSKNKVEIYGQGSKLEQIPATCPMMDDPDWQRQIKSVEFQSRRELPSIPGFTTDLCGVNPRIVSKTEILCADLDCNCKDRSNRKPAMNSFLRTSAAIPLTFTGCSASIFDAGVKRWWRNVPLGDEDWWQAFAQSQFITDGVRELYNQFGAYPDDFDTANIDLARDYEKSIFEAWVSRYSVHEQQNLRRVLADPPDMKLTHKTNFFVKKEITLRDAAVEDTAHAKPMKARGINSKSSYHKAITGPWMWKVLSHLKERFNGRTTPIIIGCGLTPQGLGQKLEDAMTERGWSFSNTSAYEADLEMCETTMRGYFVDYENMIYKHLGVPKHVREMLFDKEYHYGSDRKNQIKYKMAYCRESGTTNTTVGNTVVYATLFASLMQKQGVRPTDYLMLVGGDDCVVYYEKNNRQVEARVAAAFEEVRRAGLRPEVIHRQNPRSAVFYSGYFVNVFDNQGRKKLIHMPQLAKRLSKGWIYLAKDGYDPYTWLRDNIKARQIEWNHVPFLNKTLEPLAKLLVGRNIPHPPKNMSPEAGAFVEKDKKKFHADDLTYSQIAEIYDLTPKQLIELEDTFVKFLSKDFVGSVWDNETITHMFNIETNKQQSDV